jgi:5-methyltetrahydropteroyltriglutamate--homocysteine methyltransferase
LKRSHQRILTTHTGSLPRPTDLLEIMASRVDTEARAKRVRAAVAEVVEKQADAGVNIVSDGEMSKPSFVHYVQERVQGFEGVAAPQSSTSTRIFPATWRGGPAVVPP